MKKIMATVALLLALLLRKLWARTPETPPEQASIVAGKVATYTGAGAAVASGFSLSEWGVVIGIAVGLLGLIFGQYWAIRKARREDAESRERRAESDERRAANRRQEARAIAEHHAYLRRMERTTEPTAPMPLRCANDDQPDGERLA